jgi:N-acyl-D-amino-acid deacylase
MFDILITGGRVIDGTGLPWVYGDVGIEGDKIQAIGPFPGAEAKTRIDAAGKVVCPGFIDAHVHGDLPLLSDVHHEPAIRQGVTTYVLGQDGVAMAPASPSTLDYVKRYTAGFSWAPDPGLRWSSMAEYLNLFQRRSALNAACLVPNGNVRMEVMGLETRPPTSDELKRMRRLVREAMEQGAIGLSSGLDYIPSRYAETDELIALCQEIAPFGGIYVTHMRRYDPEGLHGSMDEVFRIGREAGCGVHVSHFNSRADLAIPKMDAGRKDGIDVTFDLYCYLAGSTIIGMIALPPWVQEGGIDPTLARLRDPAARQRLRDEWFPSPRIPLDSVRISYVADPSQRQFEGRSVPEAARMAGRGQGPVAVGDFICDLLVASNLAVGCVVPHRNRDDSDVQALMRHGGMMGGSDGIYVGGYPHPRGWGCFARYLGHYVRDTKTWGLEEAVQKLAGHPARRYGLKDRGLLRAGMAADAVVFDPATISDRSTYENGRQLAVGVEQVLVNGELVLHKGERTKALPGRPLRP